MPCDSSARMTAVGTSETTIEATSSQRLDEAARACCGTRPGITGGSTGSRTGASAGTFCPPGAKRSAMMVGVGSGCAGASA